VILLALAAIAAAYQILAILACLFRGRPNASSKSMGPVSVLKPVHGVDSGFREAILSHTGLQGDYEFLCGVSQPNDPALPVLREFSRVRVVNSDTRTANAKVGVLMDLAAAASNPVLVVNDADIRVDPVYLARVTAPLADPRVGLVTCLYRPVGDSFAARFEGLGVATDFAPSALVARLLGVDEFAMGSTLAFRREHLDRIGGFAAVADYLADDYQVGPVGNGIDQRGGGSAQLRARHLAGEHRAHTRATVVFGIVEQLATRPPWPHPHRICHSPRYSALARSSPGVCTVEHTSSSCDSTSVCGARACR